MTGMRRVILSMSKGGNGGARRQWHNCLNMRKRRNDSIFHSIFSSTFDLKVESRRASVAKQLNFSLDFSMDFSTTHITATCIS